MPPLNRRHRRNRLIPRSRRTDFQRCRGKNPGNAYAKRPVGFMMECHETHRSFLHMPIRPAIRSAGRLWFRHFQAEPQPYRSMGASLLDGVQPLLLGGLLRLKLGLLLRIGLRGDLGVKFGELGVELLLEGGLTERSRSGPIPPEWRPMPGEPAWRPSHP